MDTTSSQPAANPKDADLMPQPGNLPPKDCPGTHRGMNACPWCHFDPIFPDRPVRSVRLHFTVNRNGDRDLAYCGVRGERTTMTGEINCSDCDRLMDETVGPSD